MYHEQQRLMHCATHTLNNLFQESWADRELMDRLASQLYEREAALRAESGMGRMMSNPFKSVIPLIGDYDVNVVLEALKLRQCHVSMHVVFNPKDPGAVELALTEESLGAPSVRGVIVNFLCRKLFWGKLVCHHFYAIVKGPESIEGGDLSPSGDSRRVRNEAATGDVTGGEGGCGDGQLSEIEDKKLRDTCLERGQNTPSIATHHKEGEVGSTRAVGEDGGGERGAVWYSLDSRLQKPKVLGGASGLMSLLVWEVQEHHGHVFVVSDDGREAERRGDGIEST